MKMIKRLFTFLLVLVLVLAFAFWFLPAPLIKWAIEHFGSDAVGAKVEVDSVSFSWFPAQLELQGLVVTNPQKPMNNAVEFQRIATELDVMQAIDGKVYLEQVLVDGIALDTPRSESGALPGREQQSGDDSGFALPDLGLPDPQALIDQEKAIYQRKVDAFNTELAARQARWQGVMAQLPGQSQMKDYQAQWESVQSGNVFEKLSKAKKLSKAVQNDIDKLKDGKQQLKAEYAQLQQDYRNLAGLSDQSVEQIINQLGLSDSVIANLGNQLLGGKAQQWLQMGQGYYELLLGGEAGAQADVDAHALQAPQTSPDFLVKLIRLSGPFVHAGRSGSIDGEIKNISDAPALWPEPVSLDIDAVGDSLGKIHLQGLLAHQSGAAQHDTLSLSVKDSALEKMSLSDSESLGLLIEHAIMNFDASASITELTNLDLKMDGVFSDLILVLNDGAEASGWRKSLMQSLSSMQTLTLTGIASGTFQQPDLSVKTNLNGVLKNALSAEIKQQAKALKQQVKGELDQQLAQQLAPLQSQVNGLSGFSGEADQRINEFESMLKRIN